MRFSHGHAGNARRAFRRACKCLAGKEAPNLGAGVGRQGRKRAGFGQVCGLPCFRWFGAATPVQSACKCRQGQGPCRADSLQGMGRQRMAAVCFSSPKFSGSLLLYARLVFPLPAYPKIYQVKSFQVARNFPPCAARVFLPIFCARG